MRIYVLGDSISLRYGPYLERQLSGVMEYSRKGGEEEALLNLDVAEGANGGDSARVLSFLEVVAGKGGIEADLLLLNCGLHDIKTDPQTGARQVSLSDYRRNLESIVRIASGMRPSLVWVRTTPCDEEIHNRSKVGFHRFAADCARYNAVADEVFVGAGVPMIDLHTFTRNLGEDLFCDHVHFQDHVCQKQAAFIAGWLTAFMQVRPTRAGLGGGWKRGLEDPHGG